MNQLHPNLKEAAIAPVTYNNIYQMLCVEQSYVSRRWNGNTIIARPVESNQYEIEVRESDGDVSTTPCSHIEEVVNGVNNAIRYIRDKYPTA